MPFIGSSDCVIWSYNHYKYLCKPIQMIVICFVFPEFKVVFSTFVQLFKKYSPKNTSRSRNLPLFFTIRLGTGRFKYLSRHIPRLRNLPPFFSFVKTIHRYFYIFVEFFLTFPFAPIKIVCGIVYAAAVWAAQAFHDNRQMPGFTRQIGRSFSSAVRLMAFFSIFLRQNRRFLANKTA